MLRAPDGQLVCTDFGLMTEVTDDRRYGMIEAIALHLQAPHPAHMIGTIHRDVGSATTSNLDFIPEDRRQTGRTGARASFDAALAGRRREGINFNEDLAATWQKSAFRFPSGFLPIFALVIRAIGVLEGIAVPGDPGFAIVDEAYPYISRRLLTDTSPRPRAASEVWFMVVRAF